VSKKYRELVVTMVASPSPRTVPLEVGTLATALRGSIRHTVVLNHTVNVPPWAPSTMRRSLPMMVTGALDVDPRLMGLALELARS
jgi:hypothetical protein